MASPRGPAFFSTPFRCYTFFRSGTIPSPSNSSREIFTADCRFKTSGRVSQSSSISPQIRHFICGSLVKKRISLEASAHTTCSCPHFFCNPLSRTRTSLFIIRASSSFLLIMSLKETLSSIDNVFTITVSPFKSSI